MMKSLPLPLNPSETHEISVVAQSTVPEEERITSSSLLTQMFCTLDKRLLTEMDTKLVTKPKVIRQSTRIEAQQRYGVALSRGYSIPAVDYVSEGPAHALQWKARVSTYDWESKVYPTVKEAKAEYVLYVDSIGGFDYQRPVLSHEFLHLLREALWLDFEYILTKEGVYPFSVSYMYKTTKKTIPIKSRIPRKDFESWKKKYDVDIQYSDKGLIIETFGADFNSVAHELIEQVKIVQVVVLKDCLNDLKIFNPKKYQECLIVDIGLGRKYDGVDIAIPFVVESTSKLLTSQGKSPVHEGLNEIECWMEFMGVYPNGLRFTCGTCYYYDLDAFNGYCLPVSELFINGDEKVRHYILFECTDYNTLCARYSELFPEVHWHKQPIYKGVVSGALTPFEYRDVWDDTCLLYKIGESGVAHIYPKIGGYKLCSLMEYEGLFGAKDVELKNGKIIHQVKESKLAPYMKLRHHTMWRVPSEGEIKEARTVIKGAPFKMIADPEDKSREVVLIDGSKDECGMLGLIITGVFCGRARFVDFAATVFNLLVEQDPQTIDILTGHLVKEFCSQFHTKAPIDLQTFSQFAKDYNIPVYADPSQIKKQGLYIFKVQNHFHVRFYYSGPKIKFQALDQQKKGFLLDNTFQELSPDLKAIAAFNQIDDMDLAALHFQVKGLSFVQVDKNNTIWRSNVDVKSTSTVSFLYYIDGNGDAWSVKNSNYSPNLAIQNAINASQQQQAQQKKSIVGKFYYKEDVIHVDTLTRQPDFIVRLIETEYAHDKRENSFTQPRKCSPLQFFYNLFIVLMIKAFHTEPKITELYADYHRTQAIIDDSDSEIKTYEAYRPLENSYDSYYRKKYKKGPLNLDNKPKILGPTFSIRGFERIEMIPPKGWSPMLQDLAECEYGLIAHWVFPCKAAYYSFYNGLGSAHVREYGEFYEFSFTADREPFYNFKTYNIQPPKGYRLVSHYEVCMAPGVELRFSTILKEDNFDLDLINVIPQVNPITEIVSQVVSPELSIPKGVSEEINNAMEDWLQLSSAGPKVEKDINAATSSFLQYAGVKIGRTIPYSVDYAKHLLIKWKQRVYDSSQLQVLTDNTWFHSGMSLFRKIYNDKLKKVLEPLKTKIVGSRVDRGKIALRLAVASILSICCCLIILPWLVVTPLVAFLSFTIRGFILMGQLLIGAVSTSTYFTDMYHMAFDASSLIGFSIILLWFWSEVGFEVLSMFLRVRRQRPRTLIVGHEPIYETHITVGGVFSSIGRKVTNMFEMNYDRKVIQLDTPTDLIQDRLSLVQAKKCIDILETPVQRVNNTLWQSRLAPFDYNAGFVAVTQRQAGRVTAPMTTLESDPELQTVIRHAVRWVKKRVIPERAFSEYVKKIEPSKRVEYTKAWEHGQDNPRLSRKMTLVEKPDERQHKTYNVMKPEFEKNFKGRLICAPDFKVRAMVGFVIDTMMSIVKESFPLSFVQGLTTSQLKDRLREARRLVKDPMFMSWDGAQHDSHQSFLLYKTIMFPIYEALLKDILATLGYSVTQSKCVCDYLMRMDFKVIKYCSTKHQGGEGIKNHRLPLFIIHWLQTLSSGQAYTTLWNTFGMLVLFMTACLKAGVPLAHCRLEHLLEFYRPTIPYYGALPFQSGDDFLCVISRCCLERLVAKGLVKVYAFGDGYFSLSGTRVKDILVSEHLCEFLSRDILFIDNDTCIITRKFNRAITTGDYTTKRVALSLYQRVINGQFKSWIHKEDTGLRNLVDWSDNMPEQQYQKLVRKFWHHSLVEDKGYNDIHNMEFIDPRFLVLDGAHPVLDRGFLLNMKPHVGSYVFKVTTLNVSDFVAA